MYGSAFTGIGKHVACLIAELATKVTPEDGMTFVIFCEHRNVEPIRNLSPIFEVIGVNIPHYSLREQLIFPYVLGRARLDLMHFPHFNAPILYRGNIVVTIHDLILTFYPGKSAVSGFKEFAYKTTLGSVVNKAKRIIAVSKHTKKDLIELMGIDEEKITVVYNGVDEVFFEKQSPEKIKETAKKIGIPGKYLLYLGLHREHKNLGRLVRAFGEMVSRGYPGTLVLGGKEDPRTNEAREAVRELGLKNRVIFPGHMDFSDVLPLIQGAEIYVMPSLYEGFGLPILEAMASGVPVAASKTTSLPEVGGKAVQYFHPLRVDVMARAMEEIVKSKRIQAEMIRLGYEQVKKFSWGKMADETLATYREVLGKK
jgi:glycosyltransferase involved in cell wall biosynthesis